MKLFYAYLLLINAAAYLFMHIDKRNARKNRWRIPERVLMALAFCGGSPGILLGMKICRHKTRHDKFTVGVPVILALQILLVVLLMILI